MHLKSCRYVATDQNFAGTLTERKVKRNKIEEAQKRKPTISCEGKSLDNVFMFKYLGSLFTADGDHDRDVEKRCVMTKTRCGELHSVFNTENIPLDLKLKIYKTAVCSCVHF